MANRQWKLWNAVPDFMSVDREIEECAAAGAKSVSRHFDVHRVKCTSRPEGEQR